MSEELDPVLVLGISVRVCHWTGGTTVPILQVSLANGTQ